MHPPSLGTEELEPVTPLRARPTIDAEGPADLTIRETLTSELDILRPFRVFS